MQSDAASSQRICQSDALPEDTSSAAKPAQNSRSQGTIALLLVFLFFFSNISFVSNFVHYFWATKSPSCSRWIYFTFSLQFPVQRFLFKHERIRLPVWIAYSCCPPTACQTSAHFTTPHCYLAERFIPSAFSFHWLSVWSLQRSHLTSREFSELLRVPPKLSRFTSSSIYSAIRGGKAVLWCYSAPVRVGLHVAALISFEAVVPGYQVCRVK